MIRMKRQILKNKLHKLKNKLKLAIKINYQ